LPEVLQQALEKCIGDEFNLPHRTSRSGRSEALALQLQRQLVKRENVDVKECQRLLDDQQPLERATQLIRRHHKRDCGLGVAGLENTQIVNELRFECGMKRAGDEAEHGDRGPLIVERRSEGRREYLCGAPNFTRER
jgi:hypothetical protein